jgi:YfiR/HmsC-like
MKLRAAAAVLCLAGLARAEELAPRAEALLTLRLLAYDRALEARAGKDVGIAILHEDGAPPDPDPLALAVADAGRGYVVAGRSVRVVTCPWRGADALSACLRAGHAAALLVPARFAEAALEISRATRAARVLSFAAERRMVDAGLAIGLVQRASRAAVVVNLAAARLEGADLDATLFAVAEVVRR